MATMKYITVKSGLETLNGKYTGQFLSNGSIYLDELAEKICVDRPAVDEPELKLAALLIVEINAGQVRRKQIRRKLDPLKTAADRLCKSPQQHGLSCSGNILQQNMAGA